MTLGNITPHLSYIPVTRDELRMTLHAYQTLYESSIAFGIRKALQAEQGKTDMEGAIARLEEDKATLEKARY